MPLSINEIKTRAVQFAQEWKDASREEADAQEFEIDFLNVFGITRRKVATFEKKVKKLDNASGYIDLFWPGMIMIEMKSRGKDLQKAYEQARSYAETLPIHELPQAILICDFEHFHFYDLDNDNAKTEFQLENLVDHIELFAFMAGYQKRVYKEQDPVNIQAAELMGKIHDRLKDVGYTGHDLEVYLVRLLFCMFADDTSIFEKNDLLFYLENRTAEDGSDLAAKMAEIFEVLNTPEEKRLKTLDEQLKAFPYINGQLFEERLPIAAFDTKMRKALIECCELDWSGISPAIFGAMFQSVMNPTERRNLGAHYTSEKNILKLIHPLFLDNLWDEFYRLKTLKSGKKQRLNAFHDKIASLKFLDPACGCGNFLVITYRELRLLEIEILKELYSKEKFVDISIFCKIDASQFYGIEIEEFPAQIAKVALWLMDHQMNLKVRDVWGQYYVRIPLKTSPTIVCANALTTDWETVVPKSELNYILGNPPFGGARIISSEQKKELFSVFSDVKNCGNLDYVTCWYKKAADFIRETRIEIGFVSTNSIVQGEQPSILWKLLFDQYGIRINFAHQTFKWSNEAKGKAAVFCVIIGFALFEKETKRLFLYDSVQSEPQEIAANQINAYLIDAPNIFIENRNEPLSDVPEMRFGNMPNDGGNFILSEDEKNQMIQQDMESRHFIRPFVGSEEFINNKKRYCLWLNNVSPDQYKKCKPVISRIESVRKIREQSKRPATQKLANVPMLFGEIRQPESNYLLIPRVSSERRHYIPVGFMNPNIIASDATLIVPNATQYHFGVLTSAIHMAWMRYVCGRLGMSYRYSKDIVYNNFPWPEPNEKQTAAIETAAQKVLDARALFPHSSLADLYDPNTMPKELLNAHKELDRKVELAYRKEKFESDAQRVAFLFELYQKITASKPF